MGSYLAIAQLVASLIPQLFSLVSQAIQAEKSGDQATLDALHAQALAAANTLKPAGVA